MKGNFRFAIFTPPYDPDSGGVIVLHRLCALLRKQGYNAHFVRAFDELPEKRTKFVYLWWLFKRVVMEIIRPFRQRQGDRIPVFRWPFISAGHDWIVLYPEIILGNPLHAQNVVRWFLHRPGFHTDNRFCYEPGEFHIDFNEFTRDFSAPDAYRSTNRLNVLYIPFEHYNQEGALLAEERSGTAYCIRKGRGKPLVHDPDGAILIDGMHHEEIARIFKRVRTFVSYDPYTAYSSFAVLCGADSIVVPDPGVPIEQWYENPAERHGIAYGFHDLARARDTAHLVLAHLQAKEKASEENVRRFAEEALHYFTSRRQELSFLNADSFVK